MVRRLAVSCWKWADYKSRRAARQVHLRLLLEIEFPGDGWRLIVDETPPPEVSDYVAVPVEE
jgi:hypothetical protein